ncbi:hypothetical protein Pan44_25270 [Caulifigura coniformis]|uniref:DUF1501 domain-containing protein n=2 Tax=Caulifigura coniformis TaxID=2527983 RepID=A0A517SEE2_9PLAN|nr:hypothetical protein Pan44_25270 [Caulifigura coniformis]
MSGSGRLFHPLMSRRTAVQAGAVGLLGLGTNHLNALRASTEEKVAANAPAKRCIYIFLSGGLSQHESFDLKPEAPDGIRSDFAPIATATPGLDVCEHLPELAKRSKLWSVVRSLTHSTNDHTAGHYYMLTGRTAPSVGFRNDRKPRPTDWPSIASIVGDAVPIRNNNLPPAIVLPDRIVHWSGGVIPGNYGGLMGRKHDPFFIEASPYGNPFWKGAFPEYTFPNTTKDPPKEPDARVFQAPSIQLAPGLTSDRSSGRNLLLDELDRQRGALERSASIEQYDHQRQSAISMLSAPEVRQAFDVTNADEAEQRRYGKNAFGWSLLMALRLAQAGVNLVQVNLGNNETWDNHGEIFWRLREKLFPPLDRALSAFLDDLNSTGLLDTTLVVMGSEFGRTPKLSKLSSAYVEAGRDHWGAVQSVFFAGGGIKGGQVVGASDKIGGYPIRDPQTPENMAATIYRQLGIPETAAWHDETGRPFHIYNGLPIMGLL